MIKIKAYMFRKHMTLWLMAIFSVLVEKCYLCDYFPNPLPKNFTIFYSTRHDFAHHITNILDIPAIFIFCIAFDVINEIQMLFAARTLSSYLPRDQTLKIYAAQEIKQKLVQSGLYWGLKIGYSCIFGTSPPPPAFPWTLGTQLTEK